jgi:hypothetical protein
MNCEEQLKLIPFQSVSFGSMVIQVHKPDEFHEAQLGYSVDPRGVRLQDAQGTLIWDAQSRDQVEVHSVPRENSLGMS